MGISSTFPGSNTVAASLPGGKELGCALGMGMTVVIPVLLLPLHSHVRDVCELEQDAPVVWKGERGSCQRALC